MNPPAHQNPQLELKSHLSKNEILIWMGRPKQGFDIMVHGKSGIFLIVVFSLILIFWLAQIFTGNFGLALFLFIHILLILSVFIRLFIVEMIARKNMIYGITDKRIIIKSGIYSKSFKSFNIKNLGQIEINEREDLSGTITLGESNSKSGNSKTELKMIPSVRQVYSHIIEVQNSESLKHLDSRNN